MEKYRHEECTEQAKRCLGFFLFYSGKLLVEHTYFWLQMKKKLSSILYQAVRGKIILGWVTFPGYLPLW